MSKCLKLDFTYNSDTEKKQTIKSKFVRQNWRI